jgi:hypothetical protein
LKVITFVTDDRYKSMANGLRASAESFGLECIIIEKPDTGAWHTNCNMKCEVVLDALKTYGDEPIVWNDADCRYLQKPVLFDQLASYDMAAVFLNGNHHPFGGTLWLNGKRALPYVEAWAKNVRRFPRHEDDSINFRVALQRIRPRNIYHLPPAYCWREYDMRAALPHAKPVIVHTTSGTHNYPVTRISAEEIAASY